MATRRECFRQENYEFERSFCEKSIVLKVAAASFFPLLVRVQISVGMSCRVHLESYFVVPTHHLT
jgi:hypothetical protein